MEIIPLTPSPGDHPMTSIGKTADCEMVICNQFVL